MADDFTAKFRVDISDLKKNITEAQRQIKLANATFKSETAGMDRWSKDADGLSSKLKQLENVLEQQKKILQSYRKQLEEQQKAYDENGKRADQLRAKLQELADKGVSKTSEEYKQYESALKSVVKEQQSNEKGVNDLTLKVLEQEAAVKETEKEARHYKDALDNLGKEEEEAGKSAEKANKGFTVMKGVLADLAATAIKEVVNGLKKLGGAAIDAWKDFDAGTDTILKLTGATGEMADDLIGSFTEVSKRIVADSEDIGKAIGEVNTRFGLNGEELENLSERYLQFAEITGADVISSIDDTQKAMSAYGLEVKDAERFLDSLAATSQATGVDTATLTNGLISNATAFQEMGLSVEQAVSFMGMLEKSGTNSETVLNGMRKALKNSAKDGTSLNDALIDLQRSIEGNTDGVDGLNAAYELFGKSGDQIYGAIKNGSLSFEDLTAAVDDANGAVVNTFNSTKDASDSIKLAIQNLRTQVGAAIDKFLQEHGPEIEALLKTFTEDIIPAVIKALNFLIVVVSWVVGAFSDAWKWITTAWTDLKDFFSNFWENLKEGAKAAWEGIKKPFEAAVGWFRQVFNAVKDVVKAPINFVIRGLNKMIGGLNKISFSIPDWVPVIGGKRFGFNIGMIPELAKGGVLARGQQALLEGSGAEAVVPLERNKQWISAVAKDMLNVLRQQSRIGTAGATTTTNTSNFTQIINAPKAPSRIELYRQTRNLLEFAKGVS